MNCKAFSVLAAAFLLGLSAGLFCKPAERGPAPERYERAIQTLQEENALLRELNAVQDRELSEIASVMVGPA
ncbi:MAG TPA: hypothetical protein VHY20_04845 [Pirellulales bacterium]|jgi:hypothetical protein|nr:hypothetical protein [Pirellulales bacterium]